ncbi:hypothetical protein FISHEDRAFT_42820 [Fistulina hepatica ATCC 64428]|uniref:CCHC-type domain-containing protein n=1 Tax=Fistulina hepatica ATCC 64428 TaxID=1128425 RepID=A0A0D7ADC0_9AGAR|nr:hypothetical protein FISHEDRAFT_42820 [Fistulina hepatica ATCC 64428]
MPPRGGRVAPQFIATESSTPLAFERYWRNLEQHFDTTGITDLRQKKQWAVHYPDVQTATIMKGVAEYADNAVTWDAYKKAIEKLYIGDTDDRQWTISDLTYLCGEATRKPFMSLYEFRAFKRSFTVIYSYLKGQNKLSDTEASRMLFATLDSHIINTVASRLAIVRQDHLPGDPYPLDDLLSAIEWALTGTSSNLALITTTAAPAFSVLPGISYASQPSPAASAPAEPKHEDLTEAVSRALAQFVAKQAPQPDLTQTLPLLLSALQMHANQQAQMRNGNCNYCGICGHYIHGCPEVETDIHAGLCRRNHFHLVVLPSGAHCPKHIPGQTLHERIREYHRLNPNQRADQMEPDRQPNPAINAVPVAATTAKPSSIAISAKADKPYYAPPDEQTSGSRFVGPAYHNVAPIEDEAAARKIYEAIMNGTTTIKTKDLLSVAPEVRRQVREDTTTRRINVPIAETAKDTTKASRKSVADDPVVSYYQGHKGEGPPPAVCGTTSSALRTVMPLVNNVEEVEGVLDGGCQIVAMSKRCASNLGIAWNPDECVNLQSANGVEDKMLGLARDVPFCFHSMTVYLQCHIVDTPAYDILLGRPFYELTSAVTCSFVTGEESLTLKNPSNGKRLTFPTYRRGDAHYKVSAYTHAEFDKIEGPPTGFQTAST